MLTIYNNNRKPSSNGAYSRILLPSFHGCRCPNELLRGAQSRQMANLLMSAANSAGLGVQGDAKITLFGDTVAEQDASGPTIEFVLKASGFAIDFWPEGRLEMPSGEIVYGTGHGNLHYCNRDQSYDNQAVEFITLVKEQILRAEHLILPPLQDQPVNLRLS